MTWSTQRRIKGRSLGGRWRVFRGTKEGTASFKRENICLRPRTKYLMNYINQISLIFHSSLFLDIKIDERKKKRIIYYFIQGPAKPLTCPEYTNRLRRRNGSHERAILVGRGRHIKSGR